MLERESQIPKSNKVQITMFQIEFTINDNQLNIVKSQQVNHFK